MLAAFYYDGKCSRRYPVTLELVGLTLRIRGETVFLDIPVDTVDFGEPWQGAPRCIELPGGARCEVEDVAGMKAMLLKGGPHDSLAVRMQSRWHWAIFSLVLVIAAGIGAYLHGLPWLARQMAPLIPEAVTRTLSDTAMASLETQIFGPSKITPERQNEIAARAHQNFSGTTATPWRLHFRSAKQLGPNALALPGGDIVLLDALIALAKTPEQIDAVIAHELGHLEHRHAMRQLIQDTTVSIVLAVWLGDVSTAAISLGSQLSQSGYSRDAEFEADAYAAREMRRCCGSSEPLVQILQAMATRPTSPTNALFGSHPDTLKRISAIRAIQ